MSIHTPIKGKNFSTNNTGKRKKSDFYETPYSLTRLLLEAEPFSYAEPVLEPACGAGAITRVLSDYWCSEGVITAYDRETNFLTESREFPQMITNPPFSLAYQFIQKAKEVVSGKFSLLLPLSYLHGKTRYDDIYSDTSFRLSKVYVFTRYPLLGEPLREDGKHNTGMMVYAWFVWDRSAAKNSEPVIRWLDNNKYIIRKNNTTEPTPHEEPEDDILTLLDV